MRHESLHQFKRSHPFDCKPRRYRRNIHPRTTVAAVMGSCALVGIASVVMLNFNKDPVRLPQVFATLVDVSDPLGDAVRQQLALLEFERSERFVHRDTVIMTQLTADAEVPITPIFEIEAVPQRGRDCRWYIGCNPVDLEKQFRANVSEPYARAIDRAFLPGSRVRTPLFQGLDALSSNRPAFHDANPGIAKSLRVITDGLVHTERCSIYQLGKRAAQKNSPLTQNVLNADRGCLAEMREFPGNFRNTDVELIILKRGKQQGGYLQTHDLIEWLERYFLTGGARQVRVRYKG